MPIKDELDKEVKRLLKAHVGGEAYFGELDEVLRTPKYFNHVFGMARIFLHAKHTNTLIMSGKFGCTFRNYLRSGAWISGCEFIDGRLLLVNGGLRKGERIVSLRAPLQPGTDCMFIDDSFFSGTTRYRVATEVEMCGCRLVRTYVLYDGAEMVHPRLSSLYRYYDHYTKGNIRVKK